MVYSRSPTAFSPELPFTAHLAVSLMNLRRLRTDLACAVCVQALLAFERLAELLLQIGFRPLFVSILSSHGSSVARPRDRTKPIRPQGASLTMTILSRVSVVEGHDYDPGAWYFDIPAIAMLREKGLDLAEATVIVGENGSGKSTLVEALAHAWRRTALTAEVLHWSPAAGSEDADLHKHLGLIRERPAPQGGCFLRAEAMHLLFTGLDAGPNAGQAFEGALNLRSHGEAFLTFLESRTTERGLFLLDEPEAALSFTSCLRLLSLLRLLVRQGNQVVLATHSPVLAALPGAQILEFSDAGIVRSEWADLDLVQHWQSFLNAPQRYLRYLFEE